MESSVAALKNTVNERALKAHTIMGFLSYREITRKSVLLSDYGAMFIQICFFN